MDDALVSVRQQAFLGEKETIGSLLQFYLDELSCFPGENAGYRDPDGKYRYLYLDACWVEPERFRCPFLSEGSIAGFAFVRMAGASREMAEFYVVPGFRGWGVGEAGGTEVLQRHPGPWAVIFNKQNGPARGLWTRLPRKLAAGRVESGEMDPGHEYVRFAVGDRRGSLSA